MHFMKKVLQGGYSFTKTGSPRARRHVVRDASSCHTLGKSREIPLAFAMRFATVCDNFVPFSRGLLVNGTAFFIPKTFTLYIYDGNSRVNSATHGSSSILSSGRSSSIKIEEKKQLRTISSISRDPPVILLWLKKYAIFHS